MFSQRTNWNAQRNRFAETCHHLLASGTDLLDLTCTNPTRVGLVYEHGRTVLDTGTTCRYDPEPFGLVAARSAVSAYLRERGGTVDPDSTWLGSGTSELYAHVMTILCDPGDAVLVPQPGYPLLDYIADMQQVKLHRYPLFHDGKWQIRAEDVAQAADACARLKAIALVAPHNPTGHVLHDDEWAALTSLCAERNLALIVDEVFLDYPLTEGKSLRTRAGHDGCLTMVLSGLSKVAALPQCKLAWAAISGPASRVSGFLARAELVADTYLSVATAVQEQLPAILSAAPDMQQRIRERCRGNAAAAESILRDSPATWWRPEAGWTGLIRMPASRDDQEWALHLLEQDGVVAQPGFLFDMEAVLSAPFLAVSLLTEEERFADGLKAVRRASARQP